MWDKIDRVSVITGGWNWKRSVESISKFPRMKRECIAGFTPKRLYNNSGPSLTPSEITQDMGYPILVSKSMYAFHSYPIKPRLIKGIERQQNRFERIKQKKNMGRDLWGCNGKHSWYNTSIGFTSRRLQLSTRSKRHLACWQSGGARYSREHKLLTMDWHPAQNRGGSPARAAMIEMKEETFCGCT